MTATETVQARDEAQIRQLLAAELEAICAKDMDRLMALYADDAVVFDVKPPLRTQGKAAWRAVWEACLPYMPDAFRHEVRDLHVAVGGDVAFAHWLMRFTNMGMDHPAAETWMRFTAGYQKVGGQWWIVHEHASVPYDPRTGQAFFTREA